MSHSAAALLTLITLADCHFNWQKMKQHSRKNLKKNIYRQTFLATIHSG